MEKLCKAELCTGCGACATVCPAGCIQMEADKEGFLRPVVQEENCIGCNLCQRTCPILTRAVPDSNNTIAYAAIHENEQIRYGSTSGGIFSLLCDWIFDRGGIVFGAAYDERFAVTHYHAESSEEISRLRGAKYAQSRLGDTYAQVHKQLEQDRYVLFSGTPCQVGGLLAYLGKDYEKLVLVDLICHGVPSPKLWQHYIDYRSIQDACGQKPCAINLRSKETGWPGYSIRFTYPDGQVYSTLNSQDPYLRGFVGNLYLRPSCYNCHFKGSVRDSDFTLGDYWGVWGQLPEYHDGKGTSLVLLHTPKAKQLWEKLAGQMRFSEVEVSAALTENPSALVSSAQTEKREAFFARYEQEDFHELISELLPKPKAPAKRSFVKRAVSKLYRIIKGSR